MDSSVVGVVQGKAGSDDDGMDGEEAAATAACNAATDPGSQPGSDSRLLALMSVMT